MTQHTAHVEFDGDDAYLVFPPDVLEELDWHPGDILEWVDNGNGTYSLIKGKANE